MIELPTGRLRPTDVLAIQRQMYERARISTEGILADQLAQEPGKLLSGFDLVTCHSGHTYYVTEDMTALAKAAGSSMPNQELHGKDWPSPSGFLLYAAPLAGYEMTLVNGQRQHGSVIGFTWFVPPAPAGEPDQVHVMALAQAEEWGVLTLADPRRMMRWKVGDVPEYDELRLAPHILATWTIMQQTLVERVAEQVQRAERRRCARLRLPETVNVVRVRRRKTPVTASSERVAVDWSHRWLVAGHWRNQYVPSLGTHRQQWIAGYVKGPQDKPLVVKDRVTAWVR